ncbi:uncharacterized protein EV420DRAFT_1648541 [Desarmillaria tabescens]|uniref:Uncharacterized protein n=1 Tax=Armillaria tabescens TaxID=1929756 RepID=A0AA39MT33_ARMTA|nr:uncharacterized protein EV420DRAFT_1648541 [Desarmillaria tabescens]KAK0445024.1 hypothetical protein EV420DRAFT_1648541 [Desarmillaria tabescens]
MSFRLLRRPIGHYRIPTSPLCIQYHSLPLPPIQTLNPKALTESDFRDLSGRVSDGPLGYRFRYYWPGGRRTSLAFPNQTAGYYYYWTHSDLPATAGQLRFRVTPTNDPSLFASGSDLLKPNGMPWVVPMCRLLGLPKAEGFLQKLLEDGLMSEDLIRSEYFRIYRELHLSTKSVLLESFHDAFPLYLPRKTIPIKMISSGKVAQVTLTLDDHSWVEDLKLAEPGKKVYAHARLHVSEEAVRPGLQVVRIFSPSGEQLESDFPLITTYKWSGDFRPFWSWCLQSAKV